MFISGFNWHTFLVILKLLFFCLHCFMPTFTVGLFSHFVLGWGHHWFRCWFNVRFHPKFPPSWESPSLFQCSIYTVWIGKRNSVLDCVVPKVVFRTLIHFSSVLFLSVVSDYRRLRWVVSESMAEHISWSPFLLVAWRLEMSMEISFVKITCCRTL